MNVINTISLLHLERNNLTGSLGLVPTMGYLHEGHLSLIRQAKAENKHVAVSIFVNPAQFGPHEDLSKYPRDLEHDMKLLDNEGVDLVLVPEPGEIYPPNYQTRVEVYKLTTPLEGIHRPGHFLGVTTIITKLLNLFTPDRLYLGQKDAQQALTIQQLVSDLDYQVQVVVCPTLRDPDGVAMSSRNNYLTRTQRKAARVLYRALTSASHSFNSGERDGHALRSIMSDTIDAEPMAEEQYVSAANPDTLEELNRVSTNVLLSLAVLIGKTRLIDNMILPSETDRVQ